MRTLLALFACAIAPAFPAHAFNPIVITGGTSPDGKLAVVVGRDATGEAIMMMCSDAEDHPCLQNARTGKIIGPLTEVDTSGGGYGHVLENITAYWSPEGRYLAVRFRAGRLSESFQLYQLVPHGKSWRAVPQKLPAIDSGPNGNTIFTGATHGANMGDLFQAWSGPTEFSVLSYRYFPPDETNFNGDGVIEVIYQLRGGLWTISAYKKPPE